MKKEVFKTKQFTTQGPRDYQEDASNIFTKENVCYGILSDGCGGHSKGEVASECVVNRLTEFIDFDNFEESVNAAITQAGIDI